MTNDSRDQAGAAQGGGRDAKGRYKVQIDKNFFEASVSRVTGRELLELADKKPAENYSIYLKVKGGQPRRIGLDDKIDLAEPGVERFVTLPLDQTEGFASRRQFHLPAEDLEWLENIPSEFELVAENGVLRVVLYGYPIPPGYQQHEADLNVRIEPGYPDTRSIWCTCTRRWNAQTGVRSLPSPTTPSMASGGSAGAATARPRIRGARASTISPRISA